MKQLIIAGSVLARFFYITSCLIIQSENGSQPNAIRLFVDRPKCSFSTKKNTAKMTKVRSFKNLIVQKVQNFSFPFLLVRALKTFFEVSDPMLGLDPRRARISLAEAGGLITQVFFSKSSPS
jgi:hypothetical protein